MRAWFNARLDDVVRADIRVFGRRRPTFHICGAMGLALAVALSLGLASARGLEISVVVGLTLVCCVSFLALAMARKIVLGGERLVYYHHEIAALLAAAIYLAISHRSVLTYLDITVLGIGVLLACGRIGCLMVSCCHGRPALWGPRYRSAHVAAGLESYFEGVRLFPVPALEALCVIVIVSVGLVYRRPGDALAWYTVTYAVTRFGLEYLRGDADRFYWKGSSEAQWTSLSFVSAAALAELSGHLPFHTWHLLCALLLLALTIFNTVQPVPRQLVHPRHIREMAEAISRLGKPSARGEEISVQVTSLGLQISSGTVAVQRDRIEHYSLSRKTGRLSGAEARALAALLLRLRPGTASGTIIRGHEGVFHLVIGRGECLGSA
jgi:hypothetical protein